MSIIRHQFNYSKSLEWFSQRLANNKIMEEFKIPGSSRDQINKDIARTYFFPNDVKSSTFFFDGWQKNKDFCFSQGDMDGGMYAQYLWAHVFLTEKPVTDIEEFNPLSSINFTDLRFGYLTDKNKRAGVCLRFLNNDPKRWMLCIMQDADKNNLDEREVTFFYSDIFSPLYPLVEDEEKIIPDYGDNIEDSILQAIESSTLSEKLKGFYVQGAIQAKIIDECQQSLVSGSHYFDSWLVKFREADEPAKMIKAIDCLIKEMEEKKITIKLVKNYLRCLFKERHDFIVNNMDIMLINAEILHAYWGVNIKPGDTARKQTCEILFASLKAERTQLYQDATKTLSREFALDRIAYDEKISAQSPSLTPKVNEILVIAGSIFGGSIGLGLGFFIGLLLSPLTLGVSFFLGPVLGAVIGTYVGGKITREACGSKISLIPSSLSVSPQEKISTTMTYVEKLNIPKEGLTQSKKLRQTEIPVSDLFQPWVNDTDQQAPKLRMRR